MVTVEIFGIRATLADHDEYMAFLAWTIQNRLRCTILGHNFHSLYLYLSDEDVRRSYRSELVRIDGMPVVWLLKLAGQPAHRGHRVTWMDFFWPLMERAAAQGWRVFYVGHRKFTLQRGLSNVAARYPSLRIDGHHGFFDADADSSQSRAVVRAINRFGADLLLVGMGMPRQELWTTAQRERIEAPAVLTCGACLEYIAGDLSVPPRWLGRYGLEWAYRLVHNPRRLAYRYLVEPSLLAALLAHRVMRGHKHFERQ